MRWIRLAAVAMAFVQSSAPVQIDIGRVGQAAALTVGETFTIESKILGEVRRINIYYCLRPEPLVERQGIGEGRALPVSRR